MNWIPLAEGTLPPTTPHPKILVTNNLDARNAHGHMSHVWLVSMVLHDSTDDSWVAFEGGAKLWGLTHWRYALPEEAPASRYRYDPDSGLVYGKDDKAVAKCLFWGLSGMPKAAQLHRCMDPSESIFTHSTLLAKLSPEQTKPLLTSTTLTAQWIGRALLSALGPPKP